MFHPYTYRRQPNAGRFTCTTIFLLLVLLLPTTASYAQHNNRSHYELLWRIDGPGVSSPSYLFGTMHLTDRRVFEFSDSVLIALRNTADFAMEVDMDSMMAYMLSPGGPLLDTVNHMRRLLTADEYRYVDSLVKEKTGTTISQLNLKRLWFVEKLLLDEEEALEKNATPGRKAENIFLDGWLHQKATFLNKPVHSLERIDNQLHILSADVTTVEKEIFLQNLGYRDAGNGDAKEKTDRFNVRVAFLDSLVNLYYAADLKQISNLVNNVDYSDDGPGLEIRNREMADNLATLIKKGSVFGAVGVAHLPGEKGMLSLLRAKGYTVTPVKATFTGVARRDLQRLDSVKGYALNRIADGYSVLLPGLPVAYPIPNANQKMYIGNNETEAGFAFSIDLPQLATDKQELINTMIANMAKQGNAVLKKSYPITYRELAGTEAILLQNGSPFYIRLFIRNNRVFSFMHSAGATGDSSARRDFFRSIRFYDIVRPATTYDTIHRPLLGFSAIVPSDASQVKAGNKNSIRPVEAYSGLDDANRISYVLRVEKMQRGHYNMNDLAVLESIRTLLLPQDSSRQLIDSTVTEQDSLPLYQLVYRHKNGFMTRLRFIPRGNLAYTLLCTYDSARTNSSYWQRFFDGFHMSPLQVQSLAVPFVPADSSFSIAGPDRFTGGAISEQDGASLVNVFFYTAMDSASHSMYLAEADKYNRYYHNEPDSLLNDFIHPVDSNFIVTSERRSVWEGLPVYDTDMKGRRTGLRWQRRAIVAGHTIYRLSAILPEEVAAKHYAEQFFATFRPGKQEKTDALRLQEKKLSALLQDLQSADTTLFNRGRAYLPMLRPDSADKPAIIAALAKPFPADTGDFHVKVNLLLSLESVADDRVVHAAETLFAVTKDSSQQEKMLRFLTTISLDSAVRTFIRLAPGIKQQNYLTNSIFSYTFKEDSLYEQYLPAMITAAERSENFLEAFTAYTSADSLWRSPRFERYGLARLLPGIIRSFEGQLKEWKDRQVMEENDWTALIRLLRTGQILALPGKPTSTAAGFRQLLTDTTMTLRALGARGLISQGIKIEDKILNSILADDDVAYQFILDLKNDEQEAHIRHLLTPQLLGRSYVGYYAADDYEITAVELVTRVKVQEGKRPAEWLMLYRYKTEVNEDWKYVLNGPHPANAKKLNFDPALLHWVEEPGIATDKKQLAAEAAKAYEEYLEALDQNE
jgi:uncharacterized protein YbaP (TraB family)